VAIEAHATRSHRTSRRTGIFGGSSAALDDRVSFKGSTEDEQEECTRALELGED